ncbi:hypothetical protein [Aeromonas sp. 600584]|uniref:hypothetical protein n=1 Tax=Aeromonas TaxID=642 RepID=UPI003BA1F025
MKVNKDQLVEYTFESIDSISILSEPAVYKINIDGYYLHVYFKPDFTSDKIYIFSPGYLERKKYNHPYFQRLSWLEKINASGIVITDPTLSIHDDIGISWFQGTKERFAIPLIVKVLEKFRAFMNVQRKKVLFFGSSAGGFASLMMSCLMKGSCCVVNNPQTDVLMFREVITDKMLARCYPEMTLDKIKQSFMPRLSAAKYFIANKHVPKCLYIQNISDTEHYSRHLIPFITQLGDAFNDGNGREMFNNIIIKLYKNELAGHNPAVFEFIEPYFKLAEQEFFNV